MTVDRRHALIVGAGIGGLSAAIALRQAGWTVRVFERAASARELGFGLMLAPNAIAALRKLGLADMVLARGFAPTRGEVRRLDGTVLKRAEFPPPEVLGGPTVVALRPALHGALLETVGTDAITFSSQATGFSADGDRVTLHTDTGDAAGDLIVGADGVGSIIRRALHPSEPPPRSSDIIAVRGGVHGVVDRLEGLGGVYYLGPGVEAFLVRASDTGIYWALSLARELVPEGMRDPAAIRALMLPRMDPMFRAIAAATDDLRCDELVDRDPIPFWGRGRVTLLGDAAHPVLPHTGQGAAQAIVDAVALGGTLQHETVVEHALRAYERERQGKTAALLATGRRTARLMRSTSPIVDALRAIGVRLVPVKTLFKLLVAINRRSGTDIS